MGRNSGNLRAVGKWEKRYPAIIRLWENAWAEFVPFLRFDREIRTVICTTNAIESINARLRRAVNARGHFQGSGVFRTYGGLSGMYGCGAESPSCEHGHAT